MELHEEIRLLAEQIAACPDDTVADLAAYAAQVYRRERLMALGLAAVDSMIHDGPEEIAADDSRLVAVQEKLRDRLKNLLEWAKIGPSKTPAKHRALRSNPVLVSPETQL